MSLKKLLLCSLGVFITFYALDFVIHGYLLKDIYEQTASVWRQKEEMHKLCWCFMLAYALSSPVFVYIFQVGLEKNKPLVVQGIRYGILLGFLFATLHNLIMYAVLPIPLNLAVYWFLSEMVEFTVLGAVVGYLYKVVK